MDGKKILYFLSVAEQAKQEEKAALEEYSKQEGMKAVSSLPIHASTLVRMAVYENAKQEALNKGIKDTQIEEPSKSGDKPVRKREQGQ